MSRTITTCVVYTPTRRFLCLVRALDSLRHATTMKHRVEVIIQGPLHHSVVAPNPDNYKEFQLVVFQEEQNVGVPTRLAESIERLETDFWAKLDDDAAVPVGAWDLMVKILDEEDRAGEQVGCAFMAPRSGPIKVFRRVGDYLRVSSEPYKKRKTPFATWCLVDCVGSGATVFRRSVFDAGCHFVREYFTGCSDEDLCWQMHLKGFKAAICIEPRSDHFHGYCSPPNYDKTRYSREHFARSAEVFLARWGFVNGIHPVFPKGYK